MIILFVVLGMMEAALVKQKIRDAQADSENVELEHWYQKTTRYILTLPEKEVFQLT
jgi:hypothetical protein